MNVQQITKSLTGPVDPDRAREKAIACRNAAIKITARQADDNGLWFQAETASEAYLQQALRELTRAIEGGQYGPKPTP